MSARLGRAQPIKAIVSTSPMNQLAGPAADITVTAALTASGVVGQPPSPTIVAGLNVAASRTIAGRALSGRTYLVVNPQPPAAYTGTAELDATAILFAAGGISGGVSVAVTDAISATGGVSGQTPAIAVTAAIQADGTANAATDTTLNVTAAITADGIVQSVNGGSATRYGRLGRSQPQRAVIVTNAYPPGGAFIVTNVTIQADGVVIALPAPGGGVVTVSAAVGTAAAYRALGRGQILPPQYSRSSTSDAPAIGAAAIATTAIITAAGVVGVNSTAAVNVTAAIVATGAMSASGQAAINVTAGIVGVGQIPGTGAGPTTVTVTITASGVANAATTATLAAAAAIAAVGGGAGLPSIPVVATITASGALSGGQAAAIGVNAAIVAMGLASGAPSHNLRTPTIEPARLLATVE